MYIDIYSIFPLAGSTCLHSNNTSPVPNPQVATCKLINYILNVLKICTGWLRRSPLKQHHLQSGVHWLQLNPKFICWRYFHWLAPHVSTQTVPSVQNPQVATRKLVNYILNVLKISTGWLQQSPLKKQHLWSEIHWLQLNQK